jgi:hypothetical protein
MTDAYELAKLVERARRLRQGLHYALVAAGLAGLLLLLLIEPQIGVYDVHVPVQAQFLLEKYSATVATGEPWLIGRGAGRIPQTLAVMIECMGLLAVLAIMWGLVRRRPRVVWSSVAAIAFVWLAGPIPTPMQPMPPAAVSSETASRILAQEPEAPDEDRLGPWRPYMLAQMAFVDGDHARAAVLAHNFDGSDLASPIEAPFRMQFLRGGPILTTSVCFKFGCLGPAMLATARAISWVVLVAALLIALSLFVTWRILTQRLTRVAALCASGPLHGVAL